MADFAAVLACVDEELGTTGLSRYQQQARRIAADTLDHPFIAKLVEMKQSFEWRTSADILYALTPDDKTWHPPRGWPASAQAVTGQLTRHAPALRAQGWEISEDGGHNHRNVLRWTILPPERPGTAASRSSQTSLNGHNPTTPDTSRREDTREDTAGCGGAARNRSSQGLRPSPILEALSREDEDASPARGQCEPSLTRGSGSSAPGDAAGGSLSAGIGDRLRHNLIGERRAGHSANGPDTEGRHAGGQAGVTESTHGMTPAVQRALARARDTCTANSQPNDADPTPTPGPRNV